MYQVEKAFDRYRQELMEFPGVVGVGIGNKLVRGQDTRRPALVVLVKEKLPLSSLKRGERIPRVLGKAETDVLEVGELRLLGRTDYQRPAQPGMSIGHYRITAGTFGAVVKDRQTKEPLILSNNHVLANITNGHDGRAAIGDPILQPGPYDGGNRDNHVIGYLERFIPLYPEVEEVTCDKALRLERILNAFLQLWRTDYRLTFQKLRATPNRVDAAVARPVKQGAVVPEILELGLVRGVREPQVGMEVVKSGRSSGVTRSKVQVIQATVRVFLDEGLKGIFEDQFITGPLAKPGDSGSLVLDKENYAVGLLFAGSDKTSVSNRISNVLETLQVEF